MATNISIKGTKSSREIRNMVLAGKAALKVLGSEASGFRLYGKVKSTHILYPFGQTFDRQKDAVAYGVDKFSKTAEKVLLPKKAA